MPGIINPLDPIGSQVEQMAIDRQRQIAALLQQQSMTPAEGQMVSGHYVAPSWTQFAAKLAQGLSGKQMNEALDRKQVEYQQGSMAAMVKALGGQDAGGSGAALAQGAASGSVGPTVANAARLEAAPAAPTHSPLNPAGMDPKLAAYMLMAKPEEYWKAQAAFYAPTDATKMAVQAGMDPRQANIDALSKANKIAPMEVKPGATLFDMKTNKPVFYAAENNGNAIKYDELGQPSMYRIPGADAALAAVKAAEVAGKNSQELLPESLLPTNADGTKTPLTVGQAVRAANGGFPAGTSVPKPTDALSGPLAPGQSDSLTLLKQERAKATDPKDIAALDREIARQVPALGAKYGQKEGAEAQQAELVKKWEPLNAANQTAETATSYLQNIKGLAAKAALGSQSDKLTLANSLLSLVGDKGAADMVTANNLLDKYSNQIVARMGGGALGTDAARAILASANPSSKMNAGAINEAVDNLVGANKMVQAKTALLAPHRNANDFKGYTEKEIAFDQSADPRIWQYAAMPPAERAAFKAKLAQQGIAQEFGQKIRTLESLGVKF